MLTFILLCVIAALVWRLHNVTEDKTNTELAALVQRIKSNNDALDKALKGS